MTDADHTPWDDDLAAFAVGALDPHETAAFEGHLVHCDHCRAELLRLAPAIGLMPLSVEQLEPPPSLKRSLMEIVNAEAAEAHEPAAAPVAPRLRARRQAVRWREWLWRPAPIAGLAATLAIAFIAGFALRGGGSTDHRTTVPVQAASTAPVSAALVRSGDSWTLDVDHLPSLPANAVYQVWVRGQHNLRSGGVFVLARDGKATVGVPETLKSGDQVLITREPAGGSPAPTSTPLAQARV